MAEENARGSTPTGLWTCAAVLCCLLALLPPGHARAADPEKTRPAWIVVWGDDVGRFNSDFGYARYRQRYASVPGDPRPAPFEGAPLEYFETGRDGDPEGLDLDGDGETEDDYVACIRFSLEQPLSAPPWPHSGNYPRPFCGRFYGGYTWQVANAQPGAHQVFTEIGINPDHHWPYSDGRADDMPLKGMGDGRNPQSWHKQFLLHLWKKADFINGGDRFDVSLDGSSRLTCMFHRYWEGFNAFRFVVQDGDAFYISEESFPGLIEPDRLPKTFVLNPTETRWARYRPRGPHHIEFSPEGAEFRPHAFADVRAVGWYLAKDYAEKQISHTKWYSFEAKATVSYPPEHVSSWVETAPAGGTDQVPPFHMSTTEIPYRLWKRIYRFADMPTYVLSPRYHFRRDGDVGSCRLGRRAHSQDEPVTNITLHDAAAWCNALSELEGKAPCYYTDPEFTEVFRFEELATRYEWRKEQRRHLENPVYLNWRGEPVSPFGTGGIPLPKLYVRWSADGYRLPTPAEWSAAFEGAETAAAGRGPSTRPVGSGPANALGIHDMLGNAWEPVWAWGDSFDPAAHDTALLLGGGPEYPGDPTAPGAAASPHGDTAFDGGHNIGLRVVCRDVGLPAPATGSVPETAGAHVPTDSDEAPFWLCRKGERTGAAEEAGAPRDVPDMVPLPAGTF
ncbi:MAG: SUMF1/EgtB/PvdO family nonheme iron enzyme, partial [Candidatus Brocadiia bacterium]